MYLKPSLPHLIVFYLKFNRYKLDEDGYYRLQMVRFESAELTEQLSGENSGMVAFDGDVEPNETQLDAGPPIKGNHPFEAAQSMSVDNEAFINSSQSNVTSESHDVSTISTATEEDSDAVSVSLNDRYEALLRLYEMAKDGENTALAPLEEFSESVAGQEHLALDDSLQDIANDQDEIGRSGKRKKVAARKSFPKKLQKIS